MLASASVVVTTGIYSYFTNRKQPSELAFLSLLFTIIVFTLLEISHRRFLSYIVEFNPQNEIISFEELVLISKSRTVVILED